MLKGKFPLILSETVMVSFDEGLLYSEKALKQKKRIESRLKNGKKLKNVWLLTDPANPRNLYEIIESKLLRFSYYKNKDIRVYAVGKNRDEVVTLLLSVLEKRESL